MSDAQEPKRAMSKDEIDNLFNGDDAAEKLKAEADAKAGADAADSAAADAGVGGDAFDGNAALDVSDEVEPEAQRVEFGQLSDADIKGAPANIELLMDVKLPITVELGRNQLHVKEILGFGPGSIVELERLASEPVDLLVNGVLVARGEVVVIDDHFGVRLSTLISPEERIRSLAGNV
jgi:flagellar motor switch protein FliN